METILRHVSFEPMDITYVGIGSSPHLTEGQPLQPKYDQLIPFCFHEVLVKDKKHMRIIHFDPDFERCVPFLNEYFERWNLLQMELEGGYSWVGETLEVIVLPQRIDHDEHFWFIQSLCEAILHTKGRLVLQEYTGYEVKDLNQKLYESMENKELYKRRILLDMTYGTDTGCCTDMTKAQPFYDSNLNFLNLHFMTEEDAKRWVNSSLKLNEILKKKYMYTFLSTLNSMHVDYRRRLRGEALMFGNPLYTIDATPDEIMQVLQSELRKSFDILLLTQTVRSEMKSVLESVFSSYKEQDPYKWYEAVKKVVPPP
jgi:hypothetical protein